MTSLLSSKEIYRPFPCLHFLSCNDVCEKLDNCKDLYMKKLQSAGNSQLPNPYDLLVQKNEDCRLPDISWPDIYNYLINHPSCVFTNESLKAYKFLDAYNYFDLSRIQDVQYHEIE